jgi:hypothetical protein
MVSEKRSIKMDHNGVVLYKGPSVLDGAPIVVIATFKTSNVKTGDMVQTWIMRDDVDPIEASKQGLDMTVCGSCVHRHSLGGACYVNLGQAPLSIWRAYKRGSYPMATMATIEPIIGRALRLGAYGDPAAVPFNIWDGLMRAVKPKTRTGYTHQVAHKNFDHRILNFCMASADTPKQARKFHAMGARTFRVKTSEGDFLPNEIECLSDSKGVQCIDCGLCDGKGEQVNIAISVHGSRANRYETKYQNANIIARV